VRIDPGAPGAGITVAVSGAATADVPADSTNLAARAAHAIVPEGTDLAISIEKAIPAGAGLGGGSADAAAVLRLLRDAGHAAADRVEEVAAKLGSDIPVCVHGGAAWMKGRGEVVEPLELGAPVDLVIAVPPFGCSTPAVYRAWDDMQGPSGRWSAPAPAAVSHLLPALGNDLEPAALAVEPRLAGVQSLVEAACGAPAVLAGSGSSWFAVVDGPDAAAAAAERLQGDPLVAHAWAGRVPAASEEAAGR
jgi:4-diphosphocytidyl-2-C-methyl-D-erythritol kinase